ncbi:hypothetical protein SAMN05421797_104102 [Maribacter ulvicola]|uniref:Uncharacterized protein n=1 Tax=Maribacter ulvicola TaxID=228959 RepID=A0A1N6WIL1_9FLAO|nr:hypothetical protein SAMN05421797_104102 [Maribacter ulvicola]
MRKLVVIRILYFLIVGVLCAEQPSIFRKDWDSFCDKRFNGKYLKKKTPKRKISLGLSPLVGCCIYLKPISFSPS